MRMIEKITKKITHKGKTLIITYVKLDDGKWYRAIKTMYGHYLLREADYEIKKEI